MAELAPQPSVNDTRAQALIALINRLGQLDLTPLLVYRLDSASDSALIFLAWQFDVLQPQWQLGAGVSESIDALTDVDDLSDIDRLTSTSGTSVSDYDTLRLLVKAAIPLHRTRGTPAAIKTALAALGWAAATVLEGQSSWGGNSYPSNQGWAVFRVQINLAAGQAVASGDAARIAAAANFFKPARSLLDAVTFVAAPIADSGPVPSDDVTSGTKQSDSAPSPTDSVSASFAPIADGKTVTPYYDGHFTHIGITYGANEPAVAESGVVVNGVAISAKG